jgi:DNA-binding protein H-NS
MARTSQPHEQQAVPAIDLALLSFEELQDLKSRIDAEIDARKAKEIDVLRAKVKESAQLLGVSVEELLGLPSAAHRAKKETKNSRGKQPAKYRGPGGEEWSGRGPIPRWLKAMLAKGKAKEDFLIK